MKSMTYGGTVPVQSCRSCVVYDAQSGRIEHTHHAIVLKGGRDIPEGEVAETALKLLRERGVDVARLKVLHTSHDALEAGTVYAVDVAKGVLVEKRKLTATR
jgi:hypothetical protein